ncbi:MAG TPA: methyltransferase domain-containing protein [Candidatus Methylomirabilis sp.]|nr:methyltransferase domain-containing protein [Candidatus Methylomirabilis sp.]
MKFNDLVRGTITRFDQKGRGVFDVVRPNAPTRSMSVPFSTVGDEIEARFIKRDRGSFLGDLVRVITPGPDRVDVPSPAFDKFPGAPWLHIGYDAQLRFKRDMINAAFADTHHDESVESIIPSSVTTFYRNRMDYVFGWDGSLGLKEYGSWARYRDVHNDILLSPDVPKILDVFRELMRVTDLKPWDNRDYNGDLRYVVIREGKATRDRLIALIVKDAARVNDDAKRLLLDKLDHLATSIVIGENPLQTDLSFAQTIIPLKGDGTLTEIVNDTAYRIHLNSFFQTNSTMAATLQDIVRASLTSRTGGSEIRPSVPPPKPVTILDLYCGLGFFGINLAQRDPSLHISGFEVDAQAIELAKGNATTNGVAGRCDFTSGPAEDLSWKDTNADAVILDPPRAGLHPRVVKTLLDRKPPVIVYVSCNYHRLVEELKQFKTVYRIEDIQAVDMFPHTPHVEVVVRMTVIPN